MCSWSNLLFAYVLGIGIGVTVVGRSTSNGGMLSPARSKTRCGSLQGLKMHLYSYSTCGNQRECCMTVRYGNVSVPDSPSLYSSRPIHACCYCLTWKRTGSALAYLSFTTALHAHHCIVAKQRRYATHPPPRVADRVSLLHSSSKRQPSCRPHRERDHISTFTDYHAENVK